MASVRTRQAPLSSLLLNALLVGFFLLALVFLLAWLAPRPLLRSFISSVGAAPNPSGTSNHPTREGVDAVIARMPFVSVFFAICAASLCVLKRKLGEFLGAIPEEWDEIGTLVREQFSPRGQSGKEIAVILALSAMGILLRLFHIGRSIRYDEATTYLFFASKPLYRALSNYSYPNNHLLNTLLARVSMLTFGDCTFALRLPALVAGCVTIPMAWLTGRTLYNPSAGILAAGFVAAVPTFIEFSVNARGYSMQWIFILVMMCCSAVLLARRALKTGWLVFVLAGVAGTYSIPTMVIPIVGCVIWLLLSGLLAGGGPAYKELLKNVALAGFAVGILSILLYVPPLLAAGPAALLSNPYVASRADSFLSGLVPLAHSTWARWSDGVPIGIVYVLVGGLGLGILFHHKVSSHRVPMVLVLWLWALCFAWARNILGYPRVWSYLLLAAVLTSSAGISLALSLIRPPRREVLAALASAVFVFVIGGSLIRQRLLFRSNETVALIDATQVIEYLNATVRPGDALVVCHPATPIVQYELLRRSPKLYASLTPAESAHHVIAVLPKPVIEASYRTDEVVMRMKAQDAVDPSYASSQIDLSRYGPPHLLAKFVSVTVYAFDRK